MRVLNYNSLVFGHAMEDEKDGERGRAELQRVRNKNSLKRLDGI